MYFQPCGLCSVCCNYSTLLLFVNASIDKMKINKYGCFPIFIACLLIKLSNFILKNRKGFDSVQFSHSVVSDSATPWTAACQASLSITNSWSLLKLMSIESVMPSNHLILHHPLLLLLSIFLSIMVFSNEWNWSSNTLTTWFEELTHWKMIWLVCYKSHAHRRVMEAPTSPISPPLPLLIKDFIYDFHMWHAGS